MASRPFATINVALETEEEPPDLIGGNVKVSATFSLKQSTQNRRDLLLLSGLTVTAGRKVPSMFARVTHLPSSGSSVLCLLAAFLIMLRERCTARHLLYVNVGSEECFFKEISLVFSKPRRPN